MILPINCKYLYTKQTRNTRTTHELTKTFKMSITMSADAHTQLTNHINELGREVRELKKQNKELKEEKEWARQEGRDEKEAEYDKLAFVIGGQYEANNPSLMIHSVEHMKEENSKLKKQKRNLVELSQKVRKLDNESHQKKGDYIYKLEEENKKLKEENDSRKSLCDHFEMLNKKHYDELHKLQKENEDLKKKYEEH